MPKAKKAYTTHTRTSNRSAGTKPDPIFALIKAHEVADAACGEAATALDEFRAPIVEREKNDHRILPKNQLLSDDPCWWFQSAYDFRNNEDIAKHVREYIRLASGYFGPKTAARIKRMQKSAERELRPLLKSHLAAHRKRQDKAGYTALKVALEKAEDASSRAMRRLCSTRPRTTAGMIALLEYFRKEYEGPDGIGTYYDGRNDTLFRTLVQAMPKLKAA